MNYPLQLSFKIIALASQIYVRDAGGSLVGYVKQKLFKLKEDIRIFADEGQTQLRYTIRADRILDFSANYAFANAAGQPLGSIKRRGMRSIWRAEYEIFSPGGGLVMKINEESGWVKVVDGLIGEIPIVGMFSGYFFNPTYLLTRIDQTPVLRLSKQPAFLESKFIMEPVTPLAGAEEELVFLSCLTMTLLERMRG
jgi:hypothetical protein